jgi:hypothetical protein
MIVKLKCTQIELTHNATNGLYSVVRLEDKRRTITYNADGDTDFEVGASYVITIRKDSELSSNKVYVKHEESCAASRFPATDPGVCTCSQTVIEEN